MKYLDIENWNRKQHFEHFIKLADPYFAIVAEVDVTKTFTKAKEKGLPFFVVYLHACLKALNSIENFRYRIQEEKVVVYDSIHASATIAREDNTYGFSFINYHEDFQVFYKNFKNEKERILNSIDLFPPVNSDDCIYCSSIPWVHFTGHKEPVSGLKESVPKLAFGKFIKKEGKLMMPVSIAVHHALVDGYHVGQFFDQYQKELDKIG